VCVSITHGLLARAPLGAAGRDRRVPFQAARATVTKRMSFNQEQKKIPLAGRDWWRPKRRRGWGQEEARGCTHHGWCAAVFFRHGTRRGRERGRRPTLARVQVSACFTN